MRGAWLFLTAMGLGGCALQTAAIRTDLLDYSNVIEQSVDKMLVTNILEARDNAPLHFVEFPKINGTLQATVSLQQTFPFAAGKTGAPNTLVTGAITPNVSVQSTPNFEVDNFAAKEFVTGMSSPIDSKFIKYWVDRGLDRRLILLLFFSSMQIIHAEKDGSENSIIIRNSPRPTADQIIDCMNNPQPEKDTVHPGGAWDHCHARTQFEYYLKLMNVIAEHLNANAYLEQTVVTESTDALAPKDAAGIDPTKFHIEYSSANGKPYYRVLSVMPDQRTAVCLDDLETLQGIKIDANTTGNVCYSGIITHNEPKPLPDLRTASGRREARNDRAEIAAAAAARIVRPAERTIAPIWFRSPVCDDAYIKQHPGAVDYCSEYTEFSSRFTRRDGHNGERDIDLHDYQVKLTIRSVGEMIRYLGDLEYFQERMQREYADHKEAGWNSHHNIPVTIGYDAMCHGGLKPAPANDLSRNPCADIDGGYLINLKAKPEGTGRLRFTVSYRGEDFSVVQMDHKDHTLEVLAIINQLVNLNKSATDIRPTPVFQIVP